MMITVMQMSIMIIMIMMVLTMIYIKIVIIIIQNQELILALFFSETFPTVESDMQQSLDFIFQNIFHFKVDIKMFHSKLHWEGSALSKLFVFSHMDLLESLKIKFCAYCTSNQLSTFRAWLNPNYRVRKEIVKRQKEKDSAREEEREGFIKVGKKGTLSK